MKMEMDFQGSEISEVIVSPDEIEIRFSHAVLVNLSPSSREGTKIGIKASIRIGKPKYKKLPKKGRLTDGEVYGIPGKPLNGRIALDSQYQRDCELSLSYEDSDYTIQGKSLKIFVDLSSLPPELKH